MQSDSDAAIKNPSSSDVAKTDKYLTYHYQIRNQRHKNLAFFLLL